MGTLATYPSSPFPNLSSTPQTIFSNSTDTGLLEGINITNTSDQDILINLKCRKIILGVTTEIFLAYNFTIPSWRDPREYKDRTLFNTVELVKELGIKKNLDYTGGVTNVLIIYSNGYSQKFDCSVEYVQLTQTS